MDRSEILAPVGRLQNDRVAECSDLEAFCRFYSLALGFPILSRDASKCVLDGGGHQLTLCMRGLAGDPGKGATQTGVSIEVERLHDVFEDLTSDGVLFSSRPCCQPGGSVMVNAHDPDGNRIMLIQRRSNVPAWSQARCSGVALAA